MSGRLNKTSVQAACHSDIPDLAGLAAAYTWDSPAGVWLVPEIRERPAVLIAWYMMILEDAVDHGHVDVAFGTRWGVAIWLDNTQPQPTPANRLRRLASACGRHAVSFLRYEHVLGKLQPRTAHLRLIINAAHHPDPATALLAHRHRLLDQVGLPAHAVAHSPEQREVLMAAGYQPAAPHGLPDGPDLWPLLRMPAINAVDNCASNQGPAGCHRTRSAHDLRPKD